MEKKFEDDELNKLLDEQSMKEAELIEQALFSDNSFEDYEETDEELNASYQRLVQRLKADGIYRDDIDDYTGRNEAHGGDEADKENNKSGDSFSADTLLAEKDEEKIVTMPGYDRKKEKRKAGTNYRFAKAAGFVVVGTLCVFAASMTSEANRTYFIDTIQYWMGDDTKIVIDNDNNNEAVNDNEYNARRAIQQCLDVDVPEFMYRPEKFEYSNYEVNTIAEFAFVEYKYKNVVISLYIDKKNNNSESGNFSLHGKKVATTNISDENLSVNIFEVKDQADIDSNYVAQWKRDSIFYQISGKMERDEFIKLIEKMRY